MAPAAIGRSLDAGELRAGPKEEVPASDDDRRRRPPREETPGALLPAVGDGEPGVGLAPLASRGLSELVTGRAGRCSGTSCGASALPLSARLAQGRWLADGNVGGIAVHTAARVSALAGASEVLVSSTVTDLVAGSGIEFEDHGEHTLKCVPGEWRLYAVR